MRNILLVLVIFHLFHGYVLTDIKCVEPDWFKCGDGRCISRFFVCDGEDDCGDFSDEKNCTGFKFKPDVQCGPEEFRCTDNACIPEEFVCNGVQDCLDWSDEILGCSKKMHCDGFKCKNGYCILKEWRCDGANDCTDNSDEEDCFHKLTPEECKPEKGYFLCASQDCISLKNVCDMKKDCPDRSDEDVVGCKTAETQCGTGHCSHVCNKTPNGAVCSCRPGYELFKDKLCLDINECENYGTCDQKCENLEGSYNCSCETGYLLQSDNRTCKAENGEALMIYSSKTDIRGLYLSSQVMFYVARGLQHVVGVSLDTDYIYWSDVQIGDEAIVRSREDGSQREVIITAGLGAPEDIAVDWVTGNLYFTDGQMKHIAVCTSNGSTCTVIVQEDADKPRGISLLPSKGEMFWSDWGDKPHISKAYMDGKNVTLFITENIAWPNGLTIDYLNHRLYWVDAKLSTIESINLDGSGRRVVLHDVVKHPYSIAIFENKLYWSDWKTNSIQSCDKFTGKGHATVAKEKKLIYGIHIYHSTLKPEMQNPCIHQLCSHICLLAANATYSCGCPADKKLSSDKHSCRVTEKQKKIMVGAGHMFIEIQHEVLGRPKLSATLLHQDITAITYDPTTGTILASDRLKSSIFRYDVQTGEMTNLITTNIGNVGGMDLDHYGRNLYWCDTVFNNIEVYSLETGERMTINSQRLEAVPLELAVIPEYGILYVVLKSSSGIHIDKMQMTGLGTSTHVIEGGLLGPSVSIAYDSHLGRVFWADQGTGMIESTSFDGTDRHWFRSRLSSPVSLAILGNEIFWTAYNSKRLYWADKTGTVPGEKKITLPIPDNLDKAYLAAMTGNNYGAIDHPCLKKNGECSHICLVVSDQLRVCGCPSGMTLNHDNTTCVTHKRCKIYETKCTVDDRCIDKSKRCNGVNDCSDGEDEADCYKPVICGIDHFACKNGECIHNSKLCDSNYDCTDRSDEEDCNEKKCDEDEFRCRRGNCISNYLVCDGHNDCADGFDEENCQTHTCDPKASFTCKSGGCIPKFWECDGQVDCDDGSDEYKQCKSVTCSPKMFSCQNGHCIDTLLVCDQVDDCGDGSDERACDHSDSKTLACGPSEIRCFGTNKCLPMSARCDGVEDCPLKDDELLCTDCKLGDFTCANEKCIPHAWVCDHVDDCGDKSDEKNCGDAVVGDTNTAVDNLHCEEYRCLTGSCIPYSRVCNNVADCYDHSDENGKCETSCASSNPCEGICNKTPAGPVCTCHKGYELQNDGFSCKDIDECKLGMCSQVCRNDIGSFTCSCFSGFLLRSDGRTCKVAESPVEIIMATKADIRRISQSPNSVDVVYSEAGSGIGINSIDLNVARKIVYWSTEVTGTIFQLTLATMERKNVTRIGQPRTLSVDWVTDNVYFYDSADEQAIKVCNLEERKCAHIVSIPPETTINAMAVDPLHSFIFWGQTDSWSNANPTSQIFRSDMKGRNATSIVYKELAVVSGLAIDHLRGRLYWADRQLQLIESSNLNGNDRSVVFYANVFHPFGLNLFEDSLYWLTLGTGQITSCSLFHGNQTCKRTEINAAHSEQQFAIMHQSRQPAATNICKTRNCNHLCIVNDGEIECMCQDGSLIAPGEKCDDSTLLNPTFGSSPGKYNSDGSYVTGVMTTIFVCLVMLSAYYYYQRKKIDSAKCDLSIHFQNPSFGCDPTGLPTNTMVMAPGEHEYVNPAVNIRSKYPEKQLNVKRTIQLKESDDILTSESEDGNYLPDTRLIR